MVKSNLSKKTEINKKVLICILYHNLKCNLENFFKKIDTSKNFDFLIILDGVKKIKNQKKIFKKFKKIKILKIKKQKNSIPKNRNLAIKYLKKKHYILLFLDSDIMPNKNLVKNHLNFHIKNKRIDVAGGFVKPSFEIKTKSIWQILDGCMSWFTSVNTGKSKLVKFPYHLPTCNLSIKSSVFKKKIFFNEKIETGEDAQFCKNVREKEGKIMLISNAEVVHDDRVYFREFLEHQLKWGSHQYYTLYKENFFNNKLKLLFYPCFFIIYPILMPLINLFLSFLIILPWVKKKFYFILLQPLIYLVYLLKGLFTLKESISDSKNIFVS